MNYKTYNIKQKITTKQLIATRKLLSNFTDFQTKGLGIIGEMAVMTHEMLPNSILIKYEKDYAMSDGMVHEFKIAQIDQDGSIQFIQDKFKDVFEQAAFLSVCSLLNLEDEKEYDKID